MVDHATAVFHAADSVFAVIYVVVGALATYRTWTLRELRWRSPRFGFHFLMAVFGFLRAAEVVYIIRSNLNSKLDWTVVYMGLLALGLWFALLGNQVVQWVDVVNPRGGRSSTRLWRLYAFISLLFPAVVLSTTLAAQFWRDANVHTLLLDVPKAVIVGSELIVFSGFYAAGYRLRRRVKALPLEVQQRFTSAVRWLSVVFVITIVLFIMRWCIIAMTFVHLLRHPHQSQHEKCGLGGELCDMLALWIPETIPCLGILFLQWSDSSEKNTSTHSLEYPSSPSMSRRHSVRLGSPCSSDEPSLPHDTLSPLGVLSHSRRMSRIAKLLFRATSLSSNPLLAERNPLLEGTGDMFGGDPSYYGEPSSGLPDVPASSLRSGGPLPVVVESIGRGRRPRPPNSGGSRSSRRTKTRSKTRSPTRRRSNDRLPADRLTGSDSIEPRTMAACGDSSAVLAANDSAGSPRTSPVLPHSPDLPYPSGQHVLQLCLGVSVDWTRLPTSRTACFVVVEARKSRSHGSTGQGNPWEVVSRTEAQEVPFQKPGSSHVQGAFGAAQGLGAASPPRPSPLSSPRDPVSVSAGTLSSFDTHHEVALGPSHPISSVGNAALRFQLLCRLELSPVRNTSTLRAQHDDVSHAPCMGGAVSAPLRFGHLAVADMELRFSLFRAPDRLSAEGVVLDRLRLPGMQSQDPPQPFRDAPSSEATSRGATSPLSSTMLSSAVTATASPAPPTQALPAHSATASCKGQPSCVKPPKRSSSPEFSQVSECVGAVCSTVSEIARSPAGSLSLPLMPLSGSAPALATLGCTVIALKRGLTEWVGSDTPSVVPPSLPNPAPAAGHCSTRRTPARRSTETAHLPACAFIPSGSSPPATTVAPASQSPDPTLAHASQPNSLSDPPPLQPASRVPQESYGPRVRSTRVSRWFALEDTRGDMILVEEDLRESSYCFDVPSKLLVLLIEERRRCLQELEELLEPHDSPHAESKPSRHSSRPRRPSLLVAALSQNPASEDGSVLDLFSHRTSIVSPPPRKDLGSVEGDHHRASCKPSHLASPASTSSRVIPIRGASFHGDSAAAAAASATTGAGDADAVGDPPAAGAGGEVGTTSGSPGHPYSSMLMYNDAQGMSGFESSSSDSDPESGLPTALSPGADATNRGPSRPVARSWGSGSSTGSINAAGAVTDRISTHESRARESGALASSAQTRSREGAFSGAPLPIDHAGLAAAPQLALPEAGHDALPFRGFRSVSRDRRRREPGARTNASTTSPPSPQPKASAMSRSLPLSGGLADLEVALREAEEATQGGIWLQHRVQALRTYIRFLEAHVVVGRSGRGSDGSTFKRSVCKADPNFQFIPTNLHVQEMRVRTLPARSWSNSPSRLLAVAHRVGPWTTQEGYSDDTDRGAGGPGPTPAPSADGAGGRTRPPPDGVSLSTSLLFRPVHVGASWIRLGSRVGRLHRSASAAFNRIGFGLDVSHTLAESVYETVTVGAFAAHPYKFRNGGIRQLMQQLERGKSHARSKPQTLSRQRSGFSENAKRRSDADLVFEIEKRTDAVLCQAVTALVTAFSRKLRLIQRYMTPAAGYKLLDLYSKVGFLLGVESLLSTAGSEYGMLGDFEKGVRMLSRFSFRLLPPRTEVESLSRAPCAGSEDNPNNAFGVQPCTRDRAAWSGGEVEIEKAPNNEFVITLRLWPEQSPDSHADPSSDGVGRGLGFNASGVALPTDEDETTRTSSVSSSGTDSSSVEEDEWPAALARLVPEDLRNGRVIRVFPVIFSQGVNEKQTLANMDFFTRSWELQDEINSESYRDLLTYYTLYKRHCRLESNSLLDSLRRHDSPVLAREVHEQVAQQELKIASMNDLLATIEEQIRSSREKNISILTLTNRFVREVHGGRVTSCKSAKDRTSMSVTFEQASLLHKHHSLARKLLQPTADIMRRHGVRRANTEKNVGKARYAFNPMQQLFLPQVFRPPSGTGATGLVS